MSSAQTSSADYLKQQTAYAEIFSGIDQAKNIQSKIDFTFTEAYKALQKANIELGISFVQDLAVFVLVDNTIRIKTRSVMGTEIPPTRIWSLISAMPWKKRSVKSLPD